MSDKTLLIEIPISNLGDTIVALSCIPHLYKQMPDYNEYILKYNYIDYGNNIAELCDFPMELNIYRFDHPIPNGIDSVEIVIKPYSNNNKKHLIDCAFDSLYGIYNVSMQYKNYIKYNGSIPDFPLEVPEKYVVIHNTFLDERRYIKKENMLEIIEHIKSIGYTPVLVGSTLNSITLSNERSQDRYKNIYYNHNISTDGVINYIDKTNLHQLLYLISKANLVITADSGILHLSGMTDVNILAIFSATAPKYRLPIRNNILGYKCSTVSASPECRGCITTYGYHHICKYKNPICVDSIKSSQIIEKINTILT